MKSFKFFCLTIVILASGNSYSNPSKPRIKLPENAIQVPIVSQATEYSCGAAALLGILFYWQVYDRNESSLFKALNVTEENGTAPDSIVQVAQSFGLKAELKRKQTLADLRAALSEGVTTILEIQAWRDEHRAVDWKDDWDDGHYVDLIAMDENYLYVMDPSAHFGYGAIPMSEFMDRWHDVDTIDGKNVIQEQVALYIKGKNPLKYFLGNVVVVH